MRMPVETINYGDKVVHMNHRSFNYAFFSTLCAIVGHFATFKG